MPAPGWAVGSGSPWFEGLPELLPLAAPLERVLLCCRAPRVGLVALPAVHPGALTPQGDLGGLLPLPGPTRAAGVSGRPDSLGFVPSSLLGLPELSRESQCPRGLPKLREPKGLVHPRKCPG